MNIFQGIPPEILRIIQQYLKDHDNRQLLNTSQAIFRQLKSETVCYNLFANWSKTQMEAIEELDQLKDRLSFVRDKCKQISLHLIHLSSDILLLCIPFISSFSNIYHVHLQRIDLEHLSGLTGIKILELSHSRRLSTIEFIPGLKRLILDRLDNLTEIPLNYGNIPELQIMSCSNLSLQGLGNHEKVLIHCAYPMGSEQSNILSIFRNVTYFDLSTNLISEAVRSRLPIYANLIYLNLDWNNGFFDCLFPNLQFLKLRFADMRTKISFPSTLKFAQFHQCCFDDLVALRHVKDLIFYQCNGRGFQNVRVLSSVCKLVFNEINVLEDVSSLGEIKDLRIARCFKIKGINKLGRVHRLHIEDYGANSLEGLGQGNFELLLSGFSKKIDYSPLRSIYKLTLKNCISLVDGRDLTNVQHLSIVNCRNFEDTSALGKVKRLDLVDCNNLKRLVELEDVPYIHLERCDELEDIKCLGKQQSLIIIDCKKLKKKQGPVGKTGDRLFPEVLFVRINDPAYSWRRMNISRNIPDIFD